MKRIVEKLLKSLTLFYTVLFLCVISFRFFPKHGPRQSWQEIYDSLGFIIFIVLIIVIIYTVYSWNLDDKKEEEKEKKKSNQISQEQKQNWIDRKNKGLERGSMQQTVWRKRERYR